MMRLYDFECGECGERFEALYAPGDELHCPMCNSVRVDRLPPLVNVAMGAAGAHGYWDETLQTGISSNAQRKEEMRKAGVTEKGATPKPDGDAWY